MGILVFLTFMNEYQLLENQLFSTQGKLVIRCASLGLGILWFDRATCEF